MYMAVRRELTPKKGHAVTLFSFKMSFNILSYHPIQFLSAYLDSLNNFLSENVYFYYHRGLLKNIQVQKLECPAKAKHKRGRPHDIWPHGKLWSRGISNDLSITIQYSLNSECPFIIHVMFWHLNHNSGGKAFFCKLDLIYYPPPPPFENPGATPVLPPPPPPPSDEQHLFVLACFSLHALELTYM